MLYFTRGFFSETYHSFWQRGWDIIASLGKIEEFNSKNTNVIHYLEWLEQYFVANEVTADSSMSHCCRAILISVISGKAYDILCGPVFTGISLCTKTYAELTTILKKQFALKKLVISERYRIHTSVQAENLNVSKFAAQLQRLPTTCNFGTHLMEALWDRLVCGLRIHKRLLTEDVNFEKAVQIAQGLEAAENDVAHLMVSVLTACSSYITPQAIVTTGHTSLLKREISSIHKTRVNPLQAINGNLSV